jgi:hypothetical protein
MWQLKSRLHEGKRTKRARFHWFKEEGWTFLN